MSRALGLCGNLARGCVKKRHPVARWGRKETQRFARVCAYIAPLSRTRTRVLNLCQNPVRERPNVRVFSPYCAPVMGFLSGFAQNRVVPGTVPATYKAAPGCPWRCDGFGLLHVRAALGLRVLWPGSRGPSPCPRGFVVRSKRRRGTCSASCREGGHTGTARRVGSSPHRQGFRVSFGSWGHLPHKPLMGLFQSCPVARREGVRVSVMFRHQSPEGPPVHPLGLGAMAERDTGRPAEPRPYPVGFANRSGIGGFARAGVVQPRAVPTVEPAAPSVERPTAPPAPWTQEPRTRTAEPTGGALDGDGLLPGGAVRGGEVPPKFSLPRVT